MTPIEYSGEQKAVFNWFQIGRGNLIIEALAGSGKTETLVEGLNRANSSNPLYVVFGKLNQIEAEKRITNPKVVVKTLHGLGFGYLSRHWRGIKASGYVEFERIQTIHKDAPKQFIFQGARLVSLVKNLHINPTLAEIKKVIEERDIDLVKPVIDSGWTLDKLAEAAFKSIELCKEYPTNKKVSFEDLIYLPNVLGIVKPQYNLCVLDEAQDCNLPQMNMLINSCLPNGRICIVGDRLQSIFYFRGSMSNSMEIFKQKLNANTLTLSVSYRSPRTAIELAKQYAPNMKATDWAIDGQILNDKIDNIHNLVKPNDFVLSRKNANLVKVCLNLIRKGKPAYIEGREIGKNLWDIVESLNINNIAQFNDALDKWLAARQPINMTPRAASQFAARQDEAETLRILANSCLTIEDIKNKINSLFYDAENVRVPSTICLTVHKAKGKTTPNSFVISSSFNSRPALSPELAYEEKCIKYVSITRHKNNLTYLSES